MKRRPARTRTPPRTPTPHRAVARPARPPAHAPGTGCSSTRRSLGWHSKTQPRFHSSCRYLVPARTSDRSTNTRSPGNTPCRRARVAPRCSQDTTRGCVRGKGAWCKWSTASSIGRCPVRRSHSQQPPAAASRIDQPVATWDWTGFGAGRPTTGPRADRQQLQLSPGSLSLSPPPQKPPCPMRAAPATTFQGTCARAVRSR